MLSNITCGTRRRYAWEIISAEGGWGLDKVLQSVQHLLIGISNRITLDDGLQSRRAVVNAETPLLSAGLCMAFHHS